MATCVLGDAVGDTSPCGYLVMYVWPVEATFDDERVLHAQLLHNASLNSGCAAGLQAYSAVS